VPLGSATQQAAYTTPQRVDVPYVATIGDQLQRFMPVKHTQVRARELGCPGAVLMPSLLVVVWRY
jgi:hypothetical protein